MTTLRLQFFISLIFLTAIVGCGGPRPYSVAGTAKLKDGTDVSRLAGHSVSFEAIDPLPDGTKPSATGEIGSDGAFQLSTNATNDGAFPGKYRVAVTPPSPPLDAVRPPPVIHSKYNALNTTDLEVTIEAKDNQAVLIELEPAGK